MFGRNRQDENVPQNQGVKDGQGIDPNASETGTGGSLGGQVGDTQAQDAPASQEGSGSAEGGVPISPPGDESNKPTDLTPTQIATLANESLKEANRILDLLADTIDLGSAKRKISEACEHVHDYQRSIAA